MDRHQHDRSSQQNRPRVSLQTRVSLNEAPPWESDQPRRGSWPPLDRGG
jgi:hypothetical protein